MPILDWFLFKNNRSNVVSINIGGISNLSLISKDMKKNNVIGFDMGPGMCLIDRYVRKIWKKKYDRDGLLSNQGNINVSLLKFLMNDSNINTPPPKSISTETYDHNYINQINNKFPNINDYDILRTLVNFTAVSIGINIRNYICVGFMAMLKNKTLRKKCKKERYILHIFRYCYFVRANFTLWF